MRSEAAQARRIGGGMRSHAAGLRCGKPITTRINPYDMKTKL